MPNTSTINPNATNMALPMDVRLNNPLNIENGGPYEGEAIPPQIGGKRNFETAAFGFRAVFRNYITKYDRGIDTINALIKEWSPPGGDNITITDPTGTKQYDAYVAFVARKSGFLATETLVLKSWDTCSKICSAQVEFESGQPFDKYWKVKDMAEGAFRAGIADAPKTFVAKAGTLAAAGGTATLTAAPSILDLINTNIKPVVDAANMPTIAHWCTIGALCFAALTAINHWRSAK